MPDTLERMHHDNVERLIKIETIVEMHLLQCEKRAAAAQKLLWFVVGMNMAVLGTLLKSVLHL